MTSCLSDRLAKLSADKATAETHTDDPIAIGGRTYHAASRQPAGEIIGGLSLPARSKSKNSGYII